MNKVLPFEENVPFTGYSQYAFYLGILAGEGDDIRYLLFNHFITFCYLRTTDQVGFLELPKCLLYFSLKTFPADLEDPVGFVKTQLNEGKYVHVWLNHKELTVSEVEKNFIHDFLIYGYDDDAQGVAAYGYVRQKDAFGLKLQKFLLPYTELRQSYLAAKRKKSFPKNNYLVGIRCKPDQAVNKRKIKRDLYCYLHKLIPDFKILPVNQNVYKTLQNNILRSGECGYIAVQQPIWKILEERAVFFLSLEGFFHMPEAQQETCRQLRDLFRTAINYSLVCCAKRDRPAEYYQKAAKAFYDNLTEAADLERRIITDIYMYLKEQ